MPFSRLSRRKTTAAARPRRSEDRTRPAARSAGSSNALRQAHAFYGKALRGRQVWDTEQTAESGRLSFIISGQRVDVRTTTPVDGVPLILSVGNPQRLAERCWDAGFSVYVGDDATGATLVSVVDPFGRRIDLVP